MHARAAQRARPRRPRGPTLPCSSPPSKAVRSMIATVTRPPPAAAAASVSRGGSAASAAPMRSSAASASSDATRSELRAARAASRCAAQRESRASRGQRALGGQDMPSMNACDSVAPPRPTGAASASRDGMHPRPQWPPHAALRASSRGRLSVLAPIPDAEWATETRFLLLRYHTTLKETYPDTHAVHGAAPNLYRRGVWRHASNLCAYSRWETYHKKRFTVRTLHRAAHKHIQQLL